jgi:hypothetical protein
VTLLDQQRTTRNIIQSNPIPCARNAAWAWGLHEQQYEKISPHG